MTAPIRFFSIFLGTLILFSETISATSLTKGRANSIANQVRQLSLVVLVYHQNYIAGKSITPYPENLNDLIGDGLLTARDLEKLTSGSKIHYFKPTFKEADPTLPIFVTQCEDRIILGFASGEISSLIASPKNADPFPFYLTFSVIFAVIVALSWLFYRRSRTRR